MRFTEDDLRALLSARTPGDWTVEHRDVRGSETDDESDAGLGLEIDGPERPMLRGDFARSADARLMAYAPQIAEQLLELLAAEET